MIMREKKEGIVKYLNQTTGLWHSVARVEKTQTVRSERSRAQRRSRRARCERYFRPSTSLRYAQAERRENPLPVRKCTNLMWFDLAVTTLLIVLLWTTAGNTCSVYPDRPVSLQITGTLLPTDGPEREDLVTVRVFVQGQPWLLRIGKVEDLTEQTREQVAKDDVLLRQVRFYGPEELISQLQKPEIAGKVITIEGRLDTKEKRFLVTGVQEAATSNPQTP
jgi:hypothetical protein